MSDEKPTPGARGRAIIPMYPSGKVLIDDVEYRARCKSGYADRGDEVVVVGLDTFGLIVEKPETKEP